MFILVTKKSKEEKEEEEEKEEKGINKIDKVIETLKASYKGTIPQQHRCYIKEPTPEHFNRSINELLSILEEIRKTINDDENFCLKNKYLFGNWLTNINNPGQNIWQYLAILSHFRFPVTI